MYSAYFKLKEPPFSLSPDPRFLFMSERHREGMAHLLYGIQQPGGFVQLTGEIGSGKTTLCRCLVKQLPPVTDIALILNPRLTAIELLASICDELRAPYPAETRSIKILVDALNKRLLETYAQGRRAVLIIDEAQNLHTEVLEQIRLLTNLETSQEKLLQIILIGQPELLRILKQKQLQQLAQRITARYHLLALSRHETFAYIRHRLSVAGRSDPLFTAPAMLHVYRLSGGVPRLINIICDRALLGAYSLDRPSVSASIVCRAHRETRGILPWYRRIRPAWTAGIAGLAILAFMGAIFLSTENLSVLHGDAAAIGSNSPGGRSEPIILPSADKPAGVVGSEHGTSGDPGTIRDLQVRESGASSIPRLSAGPAVEAPKTEIVKSQPAGKFPPPMGLGLAGILDDPSLRGTGISSYTSLYIRLGIKVPSNPLDFGCKDGNNRGIYCLYRVGNWTKLRYYDLPAILELTLPSGLRHRVALVGLGNDAATLAIGNLEYTFPLQEIDAVWDGSFILLWKVPFPSRQISLGARGEDVMWVRRALDTLDGKAPGAAESDQYDEDLQRRIMAFQRNRSLPQDGLVGNATFVRLNLALMGPNAPSIARHAP